MYLFEFYKIPRHFSQLVVNNIHMEKNEADLLIGDLLRWVMSL